MPTKRAYNSSRRQESAQHTRSMIARAARKLFLERGYRGASLDAIAGEAGVAPETIYATFGSKRELLHYLLDTAIGGDEEQVKLINRPEPQAVLQETDPFRLVARFSEGISYILERAAPVFAVLTDAARTEPELAVFQDRMRQERLENMSRVIHAIARLTPLRVEEPQAVETLWTITSQDVFLLLTEVRGWSREQYVTWLQDGIIRLLFREDPRS